MLASTRDRTPPGPLPARPPLHQRPHPLGTAPLFPGPHATGTASAGPLPRHALSTLLPSPFAKQVENVTIGLAKVGQLRLAKIGLCTPSTPDKSPETINHPMLPTSSVLGGLLSYTNNSTPTQVTFPGKIRLEKNLDILHASFSLKAVDFSTAGEKRSAHLRVTRLGAGPTHSKP